MTNIIQNDTPEFVYVINWTSSSGFYGETLNETCKMSGYNRYDAIDRMMDVVENRYHLSDVEIIDVASLESQPTAPAIVITLDDIEIVQLDLFCGITDTYVEFFDYTQPIPATITAPTLPELMHKLSTAGFSLDTTLSNLTAMEGLNS